MKKSLIALAALSAFATAAQAQSSVTLYGSIDTGYSDVSSKVLTQATGVTATTTNAGIANSSDVSSRWGMKGSEDLGGGMKANFNVETSIGSGTNSALNGNTTATGAWTHATNIGNRAMWAGISTNGGLEVRGGLQNQFIRDTALAYNADGTTNVAGNLLAGNSGVFADRHNAISVTQTMGAFKFGAAVSGRSTEVTNAADVDAGKGYEVMANYAAGNFALGGALRKVDNSAAAVTAAAKQTAANTLLGLNAGNAIAVGSFDATAATAAETETMVIGGSYNFGPVKAFAAYGTQDVKDTLAVGANKAELEVTTLGVNGSIGKTTLFATYSTGESQGAAVGAVSRDRDGYVMGARYALSKRTGLYAIYGQTDIDAGNNAVATTSTKVDQFAVGLNHAF
jgi:predicted porin